MLVFLALFQEDSSLAGVSRTPDCGEAHKTSKQQEERL